MKYMYLCWAITNTLFRHPYTSSTGQIFSYAPKRWRLEAQGRVEADKAKKETGGESKPSGTSPTSGLIQTLEGGVLTKRSSRIASRKDTGEG